MGSSAEASFDAIAGELNARLGEIRRKWLALVPDYPGADVIRASNGVAELMRRDIPAALDDFNAALVIEFAAWTGVDLSPSSRSELRSLIADAMEEECIAWRFADETRAVMRSLAEEGEAA